MRKTLSMITIALCALCVSASNKMASQKWVDYKLSNFSPTSEVMQAWVTRVVANALSLNKAIMPVSVDAGTNGTITASFESATDYALCVTNSANLVITNGTLFAWNGAGAYTNAILETAIFATSSNFVFESRSSTVINEMDGFDYDAGFCVFGIKITPSRAAILRGE